MATLPTSNLSVNLILTTLGVSSAKEIFYNGSILKTVAELEVLVSKNGLNPLYCPGADADARITNLLNDRKLSYFKGYQPEPVKLSIYDRGTANYGFTFEEILGTAHTYSFEVDHLAVGRTDASGATSTIRFRSSDSIPIKTGATLHFIYDDLVTTSGSVTDLEASILDPGVADPNAAEVSPVDTSTEVTVDSSGSFILANQNVSCRFQLRSNAAQFNIKILEIYLMQ